ncbi:hypothetical protein PSAB6_250139 [Paraburkholderia sabiae]|nr:hypothetical protein PSAB6_250139 [Paraburkholderia sabiae]
MRAYSTGQFLLIQLSSAEGKLGEHVNTISGTEPVIYCHSQFNAHESAAIISWITVLPTLKSAVCSAAWAG